MNKLGGIGLIGILAIVAGAFFVLNYFNVISLSLLYPKYFGSLPHQSLNLPRIGSSINILSCPIGATPCGGKQLIVNGKYYGFGFQVPTGMTLRAVFTGTAVFKPEKEGASHINITGKGDATGYEAVYDYFGSSSDSAQFKVMDVSQDEFMNRIGNGTFDQNGTNLIFRLLDKNGKDVELKPIDFRTRM